jgi:hypothetical protein
MINTVLSFKLTAPHDLPWLRYPPVWTDKIMQKERKH